MDHNLPAVEFDEASFSGLARLFPLPGVSLFPGIVLPLHVFEERYLALVDDALDSDGLIAMAVLKPGWEPDYSGRPPIEEAACLGKIVTYHKLADGRYNLFLAGLHRTRVLGEVEPPEAFRRARVELTHEPDLDDQNTEVASTRERLTAAFEASLPWEEAPPVLQQVFRSGASLGMLADLAAYALPVDDSLKRKMLAEPDPLARANHMLRLLESEGGASGLQWGPTEPFSDN